MTTKVDTLKDLLLDVLIRELSQDSVDPRFLTNARQVVADFSDELSKPDADEAQKRETLHRFLEARRGLQVVKG